MLLLLQLLRASACQMQLLVPHAHAATLFFCTCLPIPPGVLPPPCMTRRHCQTPSIHHAAALIPSSKRCCWSCWTPSTCADEGQLQWAVFLVEVDSLRFGTAHIC